MTKFIDLYNLVLEELTNAQKKLVDNFTDKREKGLSFGPIFYVKFNKIEFQKAFKINEKD